MTVHLHLELRMSMNGALPPLSVVVEDREKFNKIKFDEI
jgi:hypothetical protein